MAVKKQCSVCKKYFEPCNSCDSNIPDELRWRRVVCCPEHFNIHFPIIRFVREQISREEAEKELKEAFDAYGKPDFNDSAAAIVKKIMPESKKENAAVNSHADRYDKRSSKRQNRYWSYSNDEKDAE